MIKATLRAKCAALLTLIVFQPNTAAAQTAPYNWGYCITNTGACNINYYAQTPPDVCANVLAYYGGCGGNHLIDLSPGSYTYFGVTYPAWNCTWNYNITTGGCAGGPFTDEITANCPTGYVANMFAPGGCSAPTEPKNFGTAYQCSTATCQPEVGKPISLATGNMFEQAVDFRTAGINPLEFVRYYNSQSQHDGILGTGWQANWERSLNVKSTSAITVERADGQQLEFSFIGSTWSPNDADVTLVLAASGSDFTLTDPSGTVETYDSNGAIGRLYQWL
jgi:Domain of unknown function (DUF6531)